MTTTEAIQEILTHSRNGEHGTLTFPCHVVPGSAVTAQDVEDKVNEILGHLHIDGIAEFDGATLTVVL